MEAKNQEGRKMTPGQKVYHNGKKYRIVAVHGSNTYTIRNKRGEQKLVNKYELRKRFGVYHYKQIFDDSIICFVELPTIKAVIYISMFLLMVSFLLILFLKA